MHFESSGPESQVSAGETELTDQVLIFLYILKDKNDQYLFLKYFDNKSFKINKKPPINKQRKQKKYDLIIYIC